jgi:hypothetical protein
MESNRRLLLSRMTYRDSHESNVNTVLRAVLNRAVDCFFCRSRLVKFKNHSYPPFFRFEMTSRLANRHN